MFVAPHCRVLTVNYWHSCFTVVRRGCCTHSESCLGLGTPDLAHARVPMKMSLRWRVNRVRAMGGREVLHRGVRYLQGHWEQVGLGRATPPIADETRGNAWSVPLPHAMASAPYRGAAERILDGRLRLFGYYECKSEFPPTWNRDPRTGTLAPAAFGKTLNYRDARIVGDIKYLWELNRHLEL